VNKRALIISNPGEAGTSSYCNGVNVDVEGYINFLTSPSGGLWNSIEIKHLQRPTSQQLRSELAQMTTMDYLMVVFCGHGYYSATKKDTILELKKDEEIESINLKVNSKQTIILDCCRRISPEPVLESRVMKFAAVSAKLNPTKCRILYETKITSCNNSRIVMYGCNIDEYANDSSSQGGFYSSSLLQIPQDMVGNSQDRIITMVDAHNIASERVKRLSTNSQNPQIEKPRTDSYYPFAVFAY